MPLTLRLYGKSYDGARWAESHPGGRVVIESACALDAAVAERLFESSHVDPHKNLRRLEPFVLDDSPRCSSKPPSDGVPARVQPDEFRDVHPSVAWKEMVVSMSPRAGRA